VETKDAAGASEAAAEKQKQQKPRTGQTGGVWFKKKKAKGKWRLEDCRKTYPKQDHGRLEHQREQHHFRNEFLSYIISHKGR